MAKLSARWLQSSNWANEVSGGAEMQISQGSQGTAVLPGFSGNPSHSIMMICKLPSKSPPSREWMLNFGQTNTGAHHWLYNPAEFPDVSQGYTAVQFGTWSGRQAHRKLEPVGRVIAVCTTYDNTSSTYTVYVNGKVNERVSGVTFDITYPTLNMGFCIERAFTGEIFELSVWEGELSQNEVVAASTKGLKSCGSSLEVGEVEHKNDMPGDNGAAALEWSVEEARVWVETLGKVYLPYGALFEFHGIDGKGLRYDLDDQALTDIGIVNKLHRNRIIREATNLFK
eukprot:TRINITY_DN2236_c0_g2_i1.p1 TRINITY_DN2236_c0_g2~~TRINITY_DN2236_c0_g2_i1.p1  ORF type:complete len:284 (+),score=58.72 TRINITY_DN2236_c0_g2_i1:70-921(+)